MLFCPIASDPPPLALASLNGYPAGSMSINFNPICTPVPFCFNLTPLPAFNVTLSPVFIVVSVPSAVASASVFESSPRPTPSIQFDCDVVLVIFLFNSVIALLLLLTVCVKSIIDFAFLSTFVFTTLS